MSGSRESSSPFLHVMPVNPDESLSDFQARLLLTLSEGNSFPLPLPSVFQSEHLLSPSDLSGSAEETMDETSLENRELKECLIGANYIALLTKQGRAGRIRYEAREESPTPPSSPLFNEWTAQDELMANQLQGNLPVIRNNSQLIAPRQMMLSQLLSNNASQHPSRNIMFRAPLPVQLPFHIPNIPETESNISKRKLDSKQLDLETLLKFSEVEWAAGDQLFSSIAVMTSDILLVSRGQLYTWPLEDTCVHLSTAGLQLEGEEIVSLSAATLRASVATQSGKVATFYDRSITRHTDCISGNNLIATLSHPLLSVGIPPGDCIASLSVSETASYLLTKSGRVFWWGIVPSGKKLKSSPSSHHTANSVSVDAFVSLRDSYLNPSEGLLLNLSTPYCPLLAKLCPESLSSDSETLQVKLLSGEGELVKWKRSDTIFLENNPAVLGRVIAIDNELAVVNTSQHPDSLEIPSAYNPRDIKVYPLSKLQLARASENVAEEREARDSKGSVNTAQGRVQLQPLCLLEPDERRVASGTLTGFRCICLTSHLEGPLLLLERVADSRVFLLNSALFTDKQPYVFCGSAKNKLTWSNATCEEESIPASTSGFLATERYPHSKARFVASAYSKAQILLDANGHVRPIQSFYRLRPPFYLLSVAFESLSLSRILIKSQEYIVLLCVAKKRGLARAIEDRNLSLVKELTEKYLLQKSVASDKCDVTGHGLVKRPRLSESDKSERLTTHPGDRVLDLSQADAFLERYCANRNILHTSIRTPECSSVGCPEAVCGEVPSCIRWERSYKKDSFEELRWENYSKQNKNVSPSPQAETTNSILSYFLSAPALTSVVRFLLCERDVSGATPLMLALRNQDLQAASLILDYVENMQTTPESLRQQAHLYQNAIATPCIEKLSPIQTLLFNSAIPHCQFGLRTILVQCSNLSPSITPRSMLSFIQSSYPSAYRCEVYTKTRARSQASMVLSRPFFPHYNLNLEFNSNSGEGVGVGRVFPTSSSDRFLIAFSDIWEMRDAICELSANTITSGNYIALFSVHQYCGQDVFFDKWKSGVKKSYSKRTADKLDTELQRVAMVKRLLEILPSDQQAGQENLLSSVLHNKLLIQYLQDMQSLLDTSNKFTFGNKLTLETVRPIQSPSLYFGITPPVYTLQAPSEASEPEDTETVPAGEKSDNSSESVLDVLANSWSLVASGICQPGTGNAPCYSHRDSFVLSLIIDTPNSVIKSVLRTILDKIETLQANELINALRITDACRKLEEQDALVVTVVKKLLQSLVRLYTSMIEQCTHFEVEQSIADSNSNNGEARNRIFSVLRSFSSLAVLELCNSAQGLCWPLINGNLKLYHKNTLSAQHLPPSIISPSVAELCYHRQTQLVLTASSLLPTLPPSGLKLPFSEPTISLHDMSRPRSKGERSDCWGIDDVSNLSPDESDYTSESDDDVTEAQPAPDSEEVPQEYSPFYRNSPAMNTNQHGQYGPWRTRISWLADGLEGTMDNTQYQGGMMFGSKSALMINTLNGGVVLARTFSRILKSALKLLLPQPDTPLTGEEVESDSDRYLVLPRVNLSDAAHSEILSHVPQLLDPMFNWAGKLLDLAENQLEQGKRFKLDSHYTHTLPPGDIFYSREGQQRTNATSPQTNTGDYLNYLLCLNAGEASSILPVIDIPSYEHVAFILDALLYFVTNWTKCHYVSQETPRTPSSASGTQHHNATDQFNPENFFLRQSSLIVSSKHKRQQLTEPDFKTPLKLDIPLAEKPHLLKPETSKTTLFSVPSHTPTTVPPEQFPSTPGVLSYSQLEAKPLSSLCHMTCQELTGRWKHVIQAFVDVFISTGPTTEPDNFILFRAGFSGKKALFYILINDSPMQNQPSFGASFHLEIDRSQLLQDSLSKIFLQKFNRKEIVDVTFVGEPGSGGGVVAGFFTALANALKSDEKMPPKTAALLNEPGKMPEQATFYAPTPTLLTKENPLFVQRLTYYRAIGKFFAISLISRQAIPLLLSRHVLKYILGRQISWHDVGFYNADLYEGLRGMLVHCQEEDLTPETFQSIYMLNFDVTINNTLCELKPEGKSIPVTPENVREYVQLYSMFLMVGCVKEELEEMSLGFHEVIPSNCTRGLTAEDLQLLLTGGSTTVSYSNLKQQTQITFLSSLLENEKINFTKNFFKLIRRMNNNQRQQLLYFSTGSALLAGGSMTLQVNVNQRGGREAPLPTAATCGRSISMPCYLNYDILKEKVSAAISCDSYAFA